MNYYAPGCYNCGGWSTASAAAIGATVGAAAATTTANQQLEAATQQAYSAGYAAGVAGQAPPPPNNKYPPAVQQAYGAGYAAGQAARSAGMGATAAPASAAASAPTTTPAPSARPAGGMARQAYDKGYQDGAANKPPPAPHASYPAEVQEAYKWGPWPARRRGAAEQAPALRQPSERPLRPLRQSLPCPPPRCRQPASRWPAAR